MRSLVDLSIHINYLDIYPERVFPGWMLMVDLSIHVNYLEIVSEPVFLEGRCRLMHPFI
jgi:hypothetical protein